MSSRRNRFGRKEAKLQALVDRYRDDPQEADVCRIVRLFEKIRRFREAFKWAKHAKSSFPGSKSATKLYRKLKSKKTALALRQAKARAKGDPSVDNLVKLCELNRMSRKWNKAFKLASETDRRFPDSWQVQLVLGKLHFDRFARIRGEEDGWIAVDHLDRSRCLNASNYSTLVMLAMTLLRLGSYDDALNIVNEALLVAPSDQRASQLQLRIKRALGEQTATAADGRAVEDGEAGDGTELLERVLAIPGAVGAYRLGNGKIVRSSVFHNESFDFSVPAEVFESMAAACRLDAQRIGLGDFVSCSLSGEGWTVDYRNAEEGSVLAFFESDVTGEQLDEEVGVALTGAGVGE